MRLSEFLKAAQVHGVRVLGHSGVYDLTDFTRGLPIRLDVHYDFSEDLPLEEQLARTRALSRDLRRLIKPLGMSLGQPGFSRRTESSPWTHTLHLRATYRARPALEQISRMITSRPRLTGFVPPLRAARPYRNPTV